MEETYTLTKEISIETSLPEAAVAAVAMYHFSQLSEYQRNTAIADYYHHLSNGSMHQATSDHNTGQ